ncbi:glycosyltransferase family A protein [Phaeobacter sp. HF9A]|uniref:glycosyltransferase family A protein n=1 Tax=Phaeobacter sp. HF9A TaxID=2721561 RepID=UPI00142F9C8D|nr:glycosyltransferase family A protein [Phaeobacter sp. HF9A]NIZ15475.1 glycosyltransferase family 2 protein [Phaeobacter sp. HF9A]
MRLKSHNLPDHTQPNRPEVTVFCAVWHKQPDKLELLRSHWENLKRQTIPVEPCYIFDNGDTAPDWLDAPWHSFSDPLTIYEAWAAGVALARTRYVMNLNMDDRLANEGAQLLLGFIKQNNVALVGGEWLICFDHAFQKQSFGIADPAQTVFRPAWPPEKTENLRLGSGLGERGSFGPATMWDLTKTQRWYPSYFGNKDPILSIGDAIFWEYVKKLGVGTGRLPYLIGRYYSSPDAQAEFRSHDDDAQFVKHGVHSVSFAQMIPENHKIDLQELTPSKPVAERSSPPRNNIEAQSHALAKNYMTIFGKTPVEFRPN